MTKRKILKISVEFLFFYNSFLEFTILAGVRKFRLLCSQHFDENLENCAKMHLVFLHMSYEFEYFYQCLITFWDLEDSREPTQIH